MVDETRRKRVIFFRILYHLPNLISDIHDNRDLRNKTIVKCTINQSNRILFCFRGSAFVSELNLQSKYVINVQCGL